jgi:hypothetical protein
MSNKSIRFVLADSTKIIFSSGKMKYKNTEHAAYLLRSHKMFWGKSPWDTIEVEFHHHHFGDYSLCTDSFMMSRRDINRSNTPIDKLKQILG